MKFYFRFGISKYKISHVECIGSLSDVAARQLQMSRGGERVALNLRCRSATIDAAKMVRNVER